MSSTSFQEIFFIELIGDDVLVENSMTCIVYFGNGGGVWTELVDLVVLMHTLILLEFISKIGFEESVFEIILTTLRLSAGL